jgi:predicted transcriptional regulator
MPQLAIYLDEKTARKLDAAARRSGMSRSAWVRRALEAQLAGALPESFFSVLGTWEDERTADEILGDIRSGREQDERPPLD